MTIPAQSDGAPSMTLTACYGFLALPLAFAGLPLYIHIPDFYTREMGLSVAGAGIILMVLRLLDAVQDPLIGYISDKSPILQRMIILLGVFALLSGMGALLIGPPDFIPVAHWFAGGVALTALGLSMVSINLVMIGSLYSGDDKVRGRLSAMREGLSLVGMLLASILPGIFMLFMFKPEAFEALYIVFGALLLLSSLAFFRFYRSLPGDHAILATNTGLSSIKMPFNFFRSNRKFLLACFLTHIAASFPAVLFLYFVTDYLGAADKAGIFLFMYFLSGAVCMPLWLRIAAKHSAERAWLASIIVAVCSFIWAFTLIRGDYLQFGLICILSGAALGADLALPPVIMARRLQVQGGEAYAAQAYSILNLIPKIALGLSTGCAFLLLNQSGFSPSAANSHAALLTLASLYALLPCLIKGASGFIVFNLHNGATHDIQKRSSTDGHTYGA